MHVHGYACAYIKGKKNKKLECRANSSFPLQKIMPSFRLYGGEIHLALRDGAVRQLNGNKQLSKAKTT